jgi:hypothetical protein
MLRMMQRVKVKVQTWILTRVLKRFLTETRLLEKTPNKTNSYKTNPKKRNSRTRNQISSRNKWLSRWEAWSMSTYSQRTWTYPN